MGSGIDLDALVVRRGVCYDLRLPAGKITTVIGPNGAGKTSLIQLIAGILAPDKGSVRIHDVEFATPSYVRPAHRRRCGYLEQRTLLFPHLNVLENVAFGPRSRGASRASAHRRAYDELEAVGLADFAERAVTDLSGGQAQRVALARALAIDPEVVLLDEPFSALDAGIVPEQRRVLRQRLAGITTVLATHDFLDVALLADYVVELAAGEVVRATEVEEAIQRPTTQFMAGLAGVNLVNGTLIEMSTLAIGQGLSVTGQGVNILDGVAGQAIFPSTAVAVSLVPSPGALPATVKAIEDYGVTQRVISVVADHQISATLSPQAFRRLSLSVGMQVWLALDQSLVQLSSV